MESKNYKSDIKEMTELNADGNEDRGSEGEDLRRCVELPHNLKVTSDGYVNTAPSGEMPKWKKVVAPGHHVGVTQVQWTEVLRALHQENNS